MHPFFKSFYDTGTEAVAAALSLKFLFFKWRIFMAGFSAEKEGSRRRPADHSTLASYGSKQL
jgi:hypothetical protein